MIPHERRSWARNLAPTGVATLLALLLYAPVLAATDQQLAGRDLYVHFYPLWRTVADAQREGRLPERDPSRGGGAAVLPDPLAQVYYPPAWLRATLPFDLGFKLWFPLHALLAGAGAGVLARRLGASTRGACLAAAAATLAGPLVGGVRHPNVLAASAWVGFAAAGFVQQEHAGRRGRRGLALTAFAVGNMLLCGGIEVLLLLGVCAAAWILARAWQTGSDSGDVARRGGIASGRIGAATGVGALLAGAHLWPCLAWLRETARPGGLASPEAVQWAMHPVRLLETVAPGLSPDTSLWLRHLLGRNLYGEPFNPSVHLGLPVVALAVLAVVRGVGRGRARALGIGALLLLLISLGTNDLGAPFFSLTRLFPLYDSWRYPAKALFPLAVLVAALAGVGLRVVPARGQVGVFLLTVVLGVAAHLATPSSLSTLSVEAFREPPPVAETILAREAGRTPPGRFLRLRRAPGEKPVGFVAIRSNHYEQLQPNLPGLFGLHDLSVYEPLRNRRLEPFLRAALLPSEDGFDLERLAEDACVAHVLDAGQLTTREVPPRIRIVDGRGALEIVDYDATRIVASVELDTSGAVYISEVYEPAWTASLDGAPVPIEEARVAFMRVSVPAGTHRLELNYRTRGLGLGWALSLLGLGLLVALSLYAGRREELPHV